MEHVNPTAGNHLGLYFERQTFNLQCLSYTPGSDLPGKTQGPIIRCF